MQATRKTQPFRGGKGPAGPTRDAMTKGATAFGHNPQDLKRAIQKSARKRREQAGHLAGYLR